MPQTSEVLPDELMPLLPLLYVAWADGELNSRELTELRERTEELNYLSPEARLALEKWLEPSAPPGSEALAQLLNEIRRHAANVNASERMGLADLGLAMAQIRCGDDHACLLQQSRTVLRSLEDALGVVGTEAARRLLSSPSDIAAAPVEAEAAFDVAALRAILDGPHAALRARLREQLSDPKFGRPLDEPKLAYRERVLGWCTALAESGYGSLSYPTTCDGSDDLGQFIAAFEVIASFNLSLVVKFGVQFGLFGGSIQFLGTERHHLKYLKDVGTLTLPGCFAMTELGHGSNVRDIDTVARFDPTTGEFIIHTPHPLAAKEYIGNAACHGRLATVFAQLEVGDAEHGVHAFLVPIRHQNGTPKPGVTIDDCGTKLGLNGVDNGRLSFDLVRIPRANLLDRYGHVDGAGQYHSAISSPGKRFFTMLSTLVGGRVSVAAGALSAAKVGLATAIRYGAHRQQFGPAGKAEQKVLDYPSHQRRLMPRLATAYALHFALEDLKRRYVNRPADPGHTENRQIEVLAAGLKAVATEFTTETLQVCRECCGGQGYMSVNRLADLKADSDVFTTFEGDNVVLLQLVAKGLLTEFKAHFQATRFFGIVRYLARQTATAFSEQNPFVTRYISDSHLLDHSFQLDVFRAREQDLLSSAAKRLRRRLGAGMDGFQAFLECQNHLLSLARAHTEHVVLEHAVVAVKEIEDSALRAVMADVVSLYALSTLESNSAWFLENGYMEAGKARAIRKMVDRLCATVREQALPLVDSFGTPDAFLGPIAQTTNIDQRRAMNEGDLLRDGRA